MNRRKCIRETIESMRLIGLAAWRRLPRDANEPSSSQLILIKLLRQHEPASIKELSRKMSMTGSAITQMADILAKRGLVKRVADPTDRRATLLRTTTLVGEMTKRLETSMFKECEHVFAGLSDDELETLSRLHQKIVRSINQ